MRVALKFVAAGAVAVMMAVVALTAGGSQNIPTASAATTDYFLKIDGVEGEVVIESFSWGITSPRDSASGQSTGRRQYQPLIIRKRINKATPLLFRISNDGKAGAMKSLTLTKPASDGKAGYTVTFFDVFITSFAHTGDAGGGPIENVSFTYQKIEMK